MVKLEKYLIPKAKNLLNLGGQQFLKISKVLKFAYIVSKNTKDNIFHLNNYINCDQFNQLYNSELQIEKTKSANLIV